MSFGAAYGTMKHNKKRMSSGGMAESAEPDFDSKALDMVGRICQNRYSKGGQVANDVGVAEADKLPAEYDELVLTGGLPDDDSGAGNEIGNEAVAEEDEDVVSKILSSRKKK